MARLLIRRLLWFIPVFFVVTGITFLTMHALPGGPFDTDVNAVLPALNILAAVSVLVALLFFFNVFRRHWVIPGIGAGLLAGAQDNPTRRQRAWPSGCP